MLFWQQKPYTLMNSSSVADNPQTFHQALLLIASIARLAPESVLHNVMPIFTFMGSNVFHRDDSHSFRVVQQVSWSLDMYGCLTLTPFADDRGHCASNGLFAKASKCSVVRVIHCIQRVFARFHRCFSSYSTTPTQQVSQPFWNWIKPYFYT